MPHPEPPLTARELRIVRGMIDEFEYRLQRRRFGRTVLGDFRVMLALLGGTMLITLQIVDLYLFASGGR